MREASLVWLRLLFRSCTDPFDKLRSGFRPLDSMQPIVLTCLTLVQRKHCLFDGDSASGLGWCLVVVLVVCLVVFLRFLFLCCFPHQHAVFPFLSMMTCFKLVGLYSDFSKSSCRKAVHFSKARGISSACGATGEALCGETGFCCGFWTPNWCPQNHFFPFLEGAKSWENQ